MDDFMIAEKFDAQRSSDERVYSCVDAGVVVAVVVSVQLRRRVGLNGF